MILETLHAPLAGRNTFGIEATARRLVEYSSVADLQELAPIEESFFHLGAGSNLLFLNPDTPQLLLHSLIDGIEILPESGAGDEVSIRVGAGVVWDDLVAWAVASGLAGIENLSLIPGETGAAAVQNIGAYGAEIADVVETVETVDLTSGCVHRFTANECQYGYRYSAFKSEAMRCHAVTHVTVKLSRRFIPNLKYRGLAEYFEMNGLCPTLSRMRRAVIALRGSKLPDPAVLGSAGSFFTNPVVDSDSASRLLEQWPDMPQYPAGERRVKLSAGWMIDKAGWKGRSMGRAGVYTRQALVLVNLGGATGAEIAELASAIAKDVYEIFGVRLTPEVYYIQ